MTWFKIILLTALVFSVAAVAAAEEFNFETNLSLLSPYDKLTPGIGGTWRPEFLQHNRLSLGFGVIADISNRFFLENTPTQFMPDSGQATGWMYTDNNHMEMTSFDLHMEGRWRIYGDTDYCKWKSWLTLNVGDVINTGTIIQFQSQFKVSNEEIVQGPNDYISTYSAPTRLDPYISPGFLVGIGNFTVGYRQWFYFDHFSISNGEPGRMWGSLRLGYRFQW